MAKRMNTGIALDTCDDIQQTEFKEERRILLEVIGPELQSIYDDRQIEVTDFHL